jgi:pilus assembly protein CpaF
MGTAKLLRTIVAAKKNLIVGGGSGSGKTSLLNVLASVADSGERVIVIEDSSELRISARHVIRLEAQPPDEHGRAEVSIRELLRATLRMRPDRIIIGEIRGAEALDLIQAMTSGHRGCLSSVHGTLPADTLNRIETMALMSDVDLPVPVLRAQVASAIDVIIQVARERDGTRRVTHVEEIQGFDPRHGYQSVSLLQSVDDA